MDMMGEKYMYSQSTMDICNFVKVISARATKDKTLLANFVANQDCTDQENAGKKSKITKSHHIVESLLNPRHRPTPILVMRGLTERHIGLVSVLPYWPMPCTIYY